MYKENADLWLPPFNYFTMLPNPLLHDFHRGEVTALDIIAYWYLLSHGSNNCFSGNESLQRFLNADNPRTARRYLQKLKRCGHIDRIRRDNTSSITTFPTRWEKNVGLYYKGDLCTGKDFGKSKLTPAASPKVEIPKPIEEEAEEDIEESPL